MTDIKNLTNQFAEDYISNRNELQDIRKGTDGKEYESAGDAVREQIGQLNSEIEDVNSKLVTVKNLIETTKNDKYYFYSSGTGLIEADNNNFVVVKPIAVDAGEYVSANYPHFENDFSFVVNDKLVAIGKLKNYKIKDNVYKIPEEAAFLYLTVSRANSSMMVLLSTEKTITGYNISDYPQGKIKSIKIPKLDLGDYRFGKNVIKIGKGLEYEDIQTALEDTYGLDTADNPYTFIVYPGIYPRFTMRRDRNTTKWYNVRHISIIGVNKQDCIIRDDEGEYSAPPCEAFTNGLIKNLSFISTHNNKYNYTRPAYAVHLEAGTQKVTFENCYFESRQSAGLGAGLYSDTMYKFVNCEFRNLSKASDKGINHGAFFCHSNTKNSITGQELVLDNCRLYAPNSDRGLWISYAGDFENCEWNIKLMNNIAVAYTTGSSDVFISKKDGMIFDKCCYGNNFDIPS